MGIELEDGAVEHVGSEPLLSVVLLAGLLPVGRSELEQTSLRPIGQQTQQVAQVVARFDAVPTAACQQRHENRVHLAAVVAPDEEPVAAAERFTAEFSLRNVVAQRQPTIFEEAAQRMFVVQRILDGFASRLDRKAAAAGLHLEVARECLALDGPQRFRRASLPAALGC
jgi:hypothetical protein